ncbi:MAG: hypothetical protein PHZ02_14710 [Desulfocapsaceae bacterium]|nr:hypothetical protein [Desulfocapsaceae bacterium]
MIDDYSGAPVIAGNNNSNRGETSMKMKVAGVVLFAVLIFMMVGCATLESAGHKYAMRGQILEMIDGAAYLCVGEKQGAQVGQQFIVYRFAKIPSHSPKSTIPSYKRDEVGRVQIVELVGEHYALAKVLTGEVKPNDVVELK